MTIVHEALYDYEKAFKSGRNDLYNSVGVTIDNLVVAMYEAQVENRPEALEKIIELRAHVKATYPKSE